MRHSLIAVTVVALALLETPAWAQFSRSSSSLGSSSMKSNSSSSSMFGNLFGKSTSASSGNNSRATGASGTSGLSGGTSDQMLRSARGAGAFVGADANDNRNFLGFTDANGNGTSNTGLRNLRRSTSTSNVNRSQRTNSGAGRNGRSTETVRPTLNVGFDYTSPPSDSLGPKLTTRLTKSPMVRFLQPAQVTVENGTAILQGAVRSEHERALAEQVVLQEPGVRQVENRLTIAP